MQNPEWLRGKEAANAQLIDLARRKGRTVVFATPGSEELRYLDTMRANANAGGRELTHIILRTDARRIEVLEEFLHGTQHRLGIVQRLGVFEAEVHAKDFMIRHAILLGLAPEDVQVLRDMLGRSRL
jgi:large repetitive protein